MIPPPVSFEHSSPDTIEVGDLVGFDTTLGSKDHINLPIVKGKEILHGCCVSVLANSTGQITGIVLKTFPIQHEYSIGKQQKGYHYSQGYFLMVGLPEPRIVFYEDSWTHIAIIKLLAKKDGTIIFDPTSIE